MAAPNSLTSDLLPSTQVAYRKSALERLVPGFVYYKHVQADPESYALSGNNGRTASFFRYANLAAATSALDEISNPTGAVSSRESITATVAEYGNYTLVSGLVKRSDVDPSVIKNIQEVIADNARLSLDTIVRDVISSNAQIAFPNTKATGTMTSGDTITLVDVMKQVAKLRANRVGKFADGFYHVILHPYQAHDLFIESGTQSMRDLKKYNDAKTLDDMMKPDYVSGQIGSIGDIMFYETDLAKAATHNSIACREAFILGKGGFGAVNIESSKDGFNVFVNYAGDGQTSDPFRRHTTISWYAPAFVCANLDTSAGSSKNLRAIKLITASTLE